MADFTHFGIGTVRMCAMANQVHDGPMSLPDLEVINFESGKLSTPQSAAKKYRDHRDVTTAAQVFASSPESAASQASLLTAASR